jgi:hypothetical protein
MLPKLKDVRTATLTSSQRNGRNIIEEISFESLDGLYFEVRLVYRILLAAHG